MDESYTSIPTQHSESVFCLAALSDKSEVLVAGSDDGSISLIDVVNNTTISHSVLNADASVNAVCPVKTNPHQLYAAVGHQVYLCDSRMFSGNIEIFDYNEEEINHLVISEDEKRMAVCDDSGEVALVHVPTKEKVSTFSAHSNICSALAFRQTHRTELFTAGFDCKLKLWNVANKTELLCLDMQEEEGIDTERAGGIMLNPPFIHSLALSKSNELLSCGLENGATQIYYAAIRPLQYLATLPGHERGVSQVHFTDFPNELLITGGNDNIINAWYFGQLSIANGINTNEETDEEDTSTQESTEDESYEVDPNNYYPTLKNHIELDEKINWICSGQTASKHYVAVADNSSVIKLFHCN